MMQFLMSRVQASAISWSSFSACRNSRGLPTETARVKRCTVGQILSDGPIRMIQSDHPAGKRMRRRRGGANRLTNCRRDPPAKVLAARISMSHLVPLLEFNLLAQSTVPPQPGKATFNDPGQTRDLERSLSSLDD